MPTFAATVLADGATSHWRLGDTGSTAVDAIAAHNGTLVNSPTTGVAGATADANGAMTFASASSQHITWADHADLRPGATDFSFEFCIKVSAWPGASQFVVSKAAGGTPGTTEWDLFLDSSDTNSFRLRFAGAAVSSSNTTTIAGTGWHLVTIALQRSGTARFYLDGAAYGTPSISAFSANSVSSTASGFFARRAGGTPSYLNGSLDELVFYKGVLLSGAQAAAHFSALSVGVYGTGATSTPTAAMTGAATETFTATGAMASVSATSAGTGSHSSTSLVYVAPDADVTTTGWTTAPLWSKVDEDPASPDGTVITGTA